MKTRITKGLIKYGLLIAMVALMVDHQPAQAQSLGYGLRVHIPFDFTVGNKKLPAGLYSISRALSVSDDQVIKISNFDGKANTFRSTIPVTTGKAKNKSTLVFHRYGDQYYLFQIWPAGALTGRVLPTSRGERELQKESESMGDAAKKAVETEVVNIVADLP
jgi:hypothetical protein